ncbi:hypothetical protein J4Q44_G00000030 [Coregonus suidteri]|uniref:Uncharacterized protein n=1 Tax=Coregonus suidteri TaxID=861788 RepID=A0AAN8R628_9TELE
MTDPSSNTDFMAAYSGITRPNGAGCGLPRRTVLNSPPPHGRLTSLRSRDLTLGGFKKKTFVPNVHSLRKSKDELKEEAHGPAGTIRKAGGWRGTDLRDSGSSPGAKCFKKERRASEEDDNDMLQKIQRDDFLDDPGLKNNAKNRPIQLPLYQSSNFLKTEAITTPWFRASAATGPDQPLQYGPVQGVLGPDQPSVAELFHQLTVSETEELLFIQLPDTIPGQPTTASAPSQPTTAPGQPIIAPEKNAKKDSKSDGKRSSHIKAPDPAGKDVPVLSEFTEGFLGKLQIRKSGKVQLLLGDITMDVSEGAAFSFLQQLVSVRLSEGLTGDMRILGNVKHKLVCSPDFQALLQEPSPHQSAHL